jgi:hypothetical protein
MIRIYWNDNVLSPAYKEYQQQSKTIDRWEGGWWFAEEEQRQDDSSINRSAFQVVDRITLENDTTCASGSQSASACTKTNLVIEVLKNLPSDFVQTPCWKEPKLPMLWKQLEVRDSATLYLLHQEVVEQDQQVGQQDQQEREQEGQQEGQERQQERQHLFQVSFLMDMELSSLPSLVLEHLNNYSTKLHAIVPYIQQKLCSKTYLHLHSSKHSEVHAKPLEESVQQTIQDSQVSPEVRASLPKSVSLPSSQLSKSTPSSAAPKGIQTGLLCQPKILPEKQSPRKSTVHPKVQRKPPSQNRRKTGQPMKCLIQLSET